MGSPIEGMTLEEFEELRRKYLEEMEGLNGSAQSGDAPTH